MNITRLKHLDNMRAASIQDGGLEDAAEGGLRSRLYIEDDELVEITPDGVRMRKRILDEGMRRRAERQARDREEAGV